VILTVLGGSAAGGNPGQGCSGYLVESGDTRLVLDLGSATLPELRLHANPADLDGIVISHLHLDHVLDLLALRYHLAYDPDRSGRTVPLFLPPGGLAFFDRLAAALDDDGEGESYFSQFDMSEYDPGHRLDIGGLTLSFAPTIHYVPCWAIRVEDGATSIVYTADTGPAAELDSFASGAAILIAEAAAIDTSSEPWESRGHLSAEEAGHLAAAAGVDMLVLAHYWSQQGSELLLARAAAHFSGPIEIARPGLKIRV
jgi:ribonuclease BN (tRNA processing enzyme)